METNAKPSLPSDAEIRRDLAALGIRSHSDALAYVRSIDASMTNARRGIVRTLAIGAAGILAIGAIALFHLYVAGAL